MHRLQLVAACCGMLALSSALQVHADRHAQPAAGTTDDQMRRLMAPSTAELASEDKGRVYIYDSLDITLVNAALDGHFDRIQHMMFTRINHLPPSGAGPAVVEDDGCE